MSDVKSLIMQQSRLACNNTTLNQINAFWKWRLNGDPKKKRFKLINSFLFFSLVGLLTIEHVYVTWPGQQSISTMTWLQPPIHVDIRSPTSLASPDAVIELAVLPLRLVSNWGSLSNIFLVGHESGIIITRSSHRILPAFATVRMLVIILLHASCSNTPPKIVRTMRRSKMLRAFVSWTWP